MIFSEAETLHDHDTIEHKVFATVHIFQARWRTILYGVVLCVVFFQSATVPMQGFLNSIVYGWTSTGGRDNLMGGSAEMVIQFGTDKNLLLQASSHTDEEDSLSGNSSLSLSDSHSN